MSGFRNGNFVGLHRGEEADFLQRNHPAAFLLLCLIARRARYTEEPCPMTGLRYGEALIGDWKEAGLTSEKSYRCAKIRLNEGQLCAFRRARIGARRGTVATLLPQGIFSISKTGGASEGAGKGRGGDGAGTGRQTTKEPRNHETMRERESAASQEPTPVGPPEPPDSLSLPNSRQSGTAPAAPAGSGSQSEGEIMARLAQAYPNAARNLEPIETKALSDHKAILAEMTDEDWETLRVWTNEATDQSRGCKLWPGNRSQFLQNAGEALEKARNWWEKFGRKWWQDKEAKRKKKEAAQAAKSKEQDSEVQDDEPMSGEEAIAFLNEPENPTDAEDPTKAG